MIENFIISTLDGTIVFCRYYNDYGKKQREDWEQVMYKITHKTWNNAKNGNYELAVDGDKTVVYTSIDELIFFLTGSGDDDELSLMELLECIKSCLQNIFKKGFTQTSLQENYVSVCLAISECVRFGVHDQVSSSIVSQRIS